MRRKTQSCIVVGNQLLDDFHFKWLGIFHSGDVTPEASHDGTCLPGCMAANCHPRNACWKMLEASVLNLYIYIFNEYLNV